MILVILERQLGAMEPDDHGGTQTGVILWRVTDCAFKVRPTGDSSSKESHNKPLGVKLTCKWIRSWCMCRFCVSVMMVGNGGLRDPSQWYVWEFRYCWGVGICYHPFCWIVWCFLCASFGLILVLLSSLFSDFLVFGNLPRGYVVGKPSFGHGCHVGDLS